MGFGCPDCGIVPCARHRRLSEDRRLYEHEVLELREENDKLRQSKTNLLKLMKEMLFLCEHASNDAFSNGVEQSGMDEGNSLATELMDRVRTAIKDQNG